MAKKQVKNHPLNIKHHIGNDFVYLYLQLIGYPEMVPGEIFVDDLKKYRFENLNGENLYSMLKSLEEMKAFKIEKRIIAEVIEITESTIEFIKSALGLFIERFINGELIPFRSKEPYKFSKQKIIFLDKIEERAKDSQPIMIFSDADFKEFGEKFCFLPCALALVEQNYIEIVYINNDRRPETGAFYNVAFKVKDKQLQKLGAQKEKRGLKLRCFTRSADGYFQIKKNSSPKEIGSKNSRHFLLLEFLVRRGIEEKVSFDQAYKTIEHGIHYSVSKYGDDKERAIVNAKKYLQKKGKIKPYQIKIDKEQRQVWIE